MLKKDNTYTDGSWLSTGEFFVEENTVVMVGPLDGTHKLKIEQEDGQMILRYYDRDSKFLVLFTSQPIKPKLPEMPAKKLNALRRRNRLPQS